MNILRAVKRAPWKKIGKAALAATTGVAGLEVTGANEAAAQAVDADWFAVALAFSEFLALFLGTLRASRERDKESE